MTRHILTTDLAPRPRGAYSQGMRIGNFIATAGVVPLDPVSNEIVGREIKQQTTQVLDNLSGILEAGGGGATWDNVIKVTVYLARIDQDFEAFNSTYREYLSGVYPPRTTIGATLRGVLVEMDVLAVLTSPENR